MYTIYEPIEYCTRFMNQLHTVHDYYNNNCTSRYVPILLDQSCLQNYDYVTPRCTCLD